MWSELFRLPEAAEMLGLTYPVLKGWRERGVIQTMGRDRTRSGHPHFIPFIEIARLAIAARMQRLSKVAFHARWNVGPFLKALRKGITDKELRDILDGEYPRERVGGSKEPGDPFASENGVVAARSGDVLLIIGPFGDQPRAKGRAVQLVSLEQFRKATDTYLTGENTLVLVNVSDVLRRVLAQRDEIKRRQRAGKNVSADGWPLAEGWAPGRRR